MNSLAIDERNAGASRREIAEIKANPPERLFAYVTFHGREIASRYSETPRCDTPQVGDQVRVTTWTGEQFGTGCCNKVYRSNFGDRRASICVIIAGWVYSGFAVVDNGTYCRLRRTKQRA